MRSVVFGIVILATMAHFNSEIVSLAIVSVLSFAGLIVFLKKCSEKGV